MRYAILIIFLAKSITLCAQDKNNNLNFYSIKDGLTNNTIYCITKDSRGFLWVGTKEGLNRFDGLQFKKYFAEKDISHSLSSNNVFDIVEYRYGQLLIATGNGISVLNTITGEFENDKIQSPALHYGTNTIINSFFKDKQGQIWVNENGEIDILDSNLHYVERFTDRPWAKELKGAIIRFGVWQMDKSGRIWLPSDQLYIIDFAAKQVWDYNNNPQGLPYLKHRSLRCLWLDEDHNALWYAPWGLGLYKYDLSTKKEQQQLFNIKNIGERRSISAIIRNNSGHLICASGKGLYEVDPATLNYSLQENNSAGLTLFYDPANMNYWLGTYNGLFKFTESSIVNGLLINKDEKHPLHCSNIIVTRNGNIYAVYNNNLVEVKKDREDFTIYPLPITEKRLTSDMCEDKNGMIWLATSDGILLFNTDTKIFKRPSIIPDSSTHSFFNHVFCESSGIIWLTTRTIANSIYKINRQQDQIESITDSTAQFYMGNTGPSNYIEAITEDASNNIWMTTWLGNCLLRCDKKTGAWDAFPKKGSKNKMILQRDYVSLIAMNGYLWMADFLGNGLIRYDPEKDELKQFTRNDGLLSDFISNVNAGNKDELLIIGEKGITTFNAHTCKTRSNNLSSIEFPAYKNIASAYDSVKDCIVYGSENALTFIQVNKIPFSIPPPVPVINSIAIYGQQQFIDPANKFFLKYDQNNISIDFTAVQFNDADRIRFAYMLKGADKDWHYTDLNRTVQYSNLAPGDYEFRIKTANDNDNWSSVYFSLAFTITPPFWLTWWFIMLVLAAVTIIIYLLVRKRIQNIRNKAELKQKIAETEMMALRAQMNPHFIFNCINAIDNLIQTDQKEKATTYLARFAKLIRNVLESSKNNVVPFDKDYEALNLFLQLEQFRCNDKFQYELSADEELLNGDYKVPPLLIQPFVENAIHHGLMNKQGTDKRLLVHIGIENEKIKYSITDNGIGIEKAMQIKNLNKPEHVSYGMQISKERIQLYNKNTIKNDVIITDLYANGEPSGTKIEVSINLNNN